MSDQDSQIPDSPVSDEERALFAEVDGFLGLLSRALDPVEELDFVVATPLQAYASTMAPRLISTYKAVVLLQESGFVDESISLVRRLFEDSIRLHYMYKNHEEAESLLFGWRLDQHDSVLRRIRRVIEAPEVTADVRLYAESLEQARRKLRDSVQAEVEQSGRDVNRMPDTSTMVFDLGRHQDLIVWSTTSDVAHSAVSGITTDYIEASIADGRVERFDVARTRRRVTSAASFARIAVTTTTTAVVLCLRILGELEAASLLMETGLEAEKGLLALVPKAAAPE